jgi:hypothetical protein
MILGVGGVEDSPGRGFHGGAAWLAGGGGWRCRTSGRVEATDEVVREEARAQADVGVVEVGPEDDRRSPAPVGASRRKKNSVSALGSSMTSRGERYSVLCRLSDREGVLTCGGLQWLDV